jgi:membrane peptidoglycan carboxypeptidase
MTTSALTNLPMSRVVGGSLPASIWKTYMVDAHRRIAVHPLPGIYEYGAGPGDYYPVGPGEDDPWVERGQDGPGPRPDEDKGLIEDFFDSLFGDDKEEPAPAPRGAQPGFGPRHQSRNEVPSVEPPTPQAGSVTPADGEAVPEPAF